MDDQRATEQQGERVIDLTVGACRPAVADPRARSGERVEGDVAVRVLGSGRLVPAPAAEDPVHAGTGALGPAIAELVHPEDLPAIVELAERTGRTPGFQGSVRVRARHRNGTWRILDASVDDAPSMPGSEGIVLRVRDITEEHMSTRSPSDVDRFAALAEMLPLGILAADERGHVVYANGAARRLFNLGDGELRGLGWRSRIVVDDWPAVAEASAQVMATGVSQQASFRVETDLFVRWAHATFGPLGPPGAATGWVATVADVTERRSLEGRLAHQATHDPLTGLPNRSLLEDRLGRSLAALRRDLRSVTVVFLDLDGFKAVNDTYGHAAGDAVLVEVARRLRQVTRDVDTVARLGGDEFVLVCDALDAASTDGLLARIDEALHDPVGIGAVEVRVRSSVGVAVESVGCSTDELIARADRSMYRDKRLRRRHV